MHRPELSIGIRFQPAIPHALGQNLSCQFVELCNLGVHTMLHSMQISLVMRTVSDGQLLSLKHYPYFSRQPICKVPDAHEYFLLAAGTSSEAKLIQAELLLVAVVCTAFSLPCRLLSGVMLTLEVS